MDADRFGLVLQSATWVIPVKVIPAHRWIPLVNSRGVRQAHLITGHREIEGDARSLLGLPQKLLLFPANLRQSCWTKINDEKNSWMSEQMK